MAFLQRADAVALAQVFDADGEVSHGQKDFFRESSRICANLFRANSRDSRVILLGFSLSELGI